MDFYAVVSSADSLNYHPLNTPWRFISEFKAPLHFTSTWYAALCEISLSELTDEALFVYCDLIGTTYIDDDQRPLLRRVQLAHDNKHVVYNSPLYIPVIATEARSIEIRVRTSDDEPADFLQKPISLTLHFKTYLFLA